MFLVFTHILNIILTYNIADIDLIEKEAKMTNEHTLMFEIF